LVESELADSISDQTAREWMKAYRKMAIQPDAIQYTIAQPNDVDANVVYFGAVMVAVLGELVI
jgi:hypothetical protein